MFVKLSAVISRVYSES